MLPNIRRCEKREEKPNVNGKGGNATQVSVQSQTHIYNYIHIYVVQKGKHFIEEKWHSTSVKITWSLTVLSRLLRKTNIELRPMRTGVHVTNQSIPDEGTLLIEIMFKHMTCDMDRRIVNLSGYDTTMIQKQIRDIRGRRGPRFAPSQLFRLAVCIVLTRPLTTQNRTAILLQCNGAAPVSDIANCCGDTLALLRVHSK